MGTIQGINIVNEQNYLFAKYFNKGEEDGTTVTT